MRNGLFDQLLAASLAQGAEPLATEEEYWAWVRAYPARSVPILDDRAPWPMQRRQALTLLGAFTSDNYRRMRQASHDCQEVAPGTGMPLATGGNDQGEDEWHRWREGLTQRYRLDGLLSTGSESEPSPAGPA